MQTIKSLKYLLTFCFIIQANAQTMFFNNGQQVSINEGGILYINGDLHNQAGNIDNAGFNFIDGDVTNDETMTGFAANTGLYEVKGDWFNNNIFTADQSTVLLNGGNQLISGTAVTTFYNLNLNGSGIKTQTVNAFVTNELDLNDVELATNLYDMTVTNTNTDAILRNTGFVSSLGDGALYRHTNSTDRYIYPTGSSLGIFRYRPIVLTAVSSDDHTFGVRLANNDPNDDSYNRDELDTEELCAINPNFYHNLYRRNGTNAADIAMFFDASDDGAWNRIGHWQNQPRWENTSAPSEYFDLGFDAIEVFAWDDYTLRPFALAASNPTLNAGVDQFIQSGEVAMIDPTYDGATIDQVTWIPATGLDCNTCIDPNASPGGTTTYIVEVIDENACKASDTIIINVEGAQLLLPNAFSPNQDDVNDIFKPLNTNLATMNLIIYNRWGEEVFSTSTIGSGWDGTFKGEEQELGVYIYYIEYSFEGDNMGTQTDNGNLTLIR